jgi:hypothetical protein
MGIFQWGAFVTGCFAVSGPSLLFALAPSDSYGILSGDRKRETLRDLTGVEVVVEQVRPEAEQDGLSANQMKSQVETLLNEAGIRVLTPQERLTQPGHAYLYISVNTVKAASMYSYAIEISLNQTVRLTRHPTIATFAPTWVAQVAGTTPASQLHTIRENVNHYVKTFIHDYLAMNPRDSAFFP